MVKVSDNKKYGIDVSYHQGTIDWGKVKKAGIEFAIIRAGYANSIDIKFTEYARRCTALDIPFGVYWFSYALNEEMARKEARTCLGVIAPWKISYPVCFDFEYASLDYAKKNDVNISGKQMVNIAKAFLQEIENAGYYAMNYTNPDFLARGYHELVDRYDTWLSRWTNSNTPGYQCGIWQYSSTGIIDGISTNVDLDVAFKDYPAIINKKEQATNEEADNKEAIKNKIAEIRKNLDELESMV